MSRDDVTAYPHNGIELDDDNQLPHVALESLLSEAHGVEYERLVMHAATGQVIYDGTLPLDVLIGTVFEGYDLYVSTWPAWLWSVVGVSGRVILVAALETLDCDDCGRPARVAEVVSYQMLDGDERYTAHYCGDCDATRDMLGANDTDDDEAAAERAIAATEAGLGVAGLSDAELAERDAADDGDDDGVRLPDEGRRHVRRAGMVVGDDDDGALDFDDVPF